jgi:hypothetical protein
MAGTWLETFLGLTGKYVLSFIDKYYFYFIPVILVYGIFLALSSFNLKRLEKGLIRYILKRTDYILKENPDTGFISLLEKLELSLEDIIKRYSFFPFISNDSGFWVLRTNLANTRDLLLKDQRRILLLLNRKGVTFSQEKKRLRENLYLEVIHKISESKRTR